MVLAVKVKMVIGMNFAVPSRSVLFKAGAAYKTNTKYPGITGDLLHCFT